MAYSDKVVTLWMTMLIVYSMVLTPVEQHRNCYSGDLDDDTCKVRKCKWGYEPNCTKKQWFQVPSCTSEQDHRLFASLEDKVQAFWEETDFGYVRNASPSHYICNSEEKGGSRLYCNGRLTYCHGKNILFDFSKDDFPFESSDVSERSLFGGQCELQNTHLMEKNFYDSGLISWSRHLKHFKELRFPVDDSSCDLVVERPTFMLELDAIGNMYHHFCDFFNLYITKHVYGSLKKNIDIAFWEKHNRRSLGPFGETWSLFTDSDVYAVGNKYRGKRICFKNIIFGLLPRMGYGMYYSTPVIAGCSHSGLFRAFSKFVTNGFKIKQERKDKNLPIRVTLLVRETQYRRILNQDELLGIMQKEPDLTVRKVAFNVNIPFKEQLQLSHNTDLFIGVHGAGLTHALFMPNWGTLFELYNTNDIRCYRDLARLRGLTYITWERNEMIKSEGVSPTIQDTNAKFGNFRFDNEEFSRLFKLAVKQTRKKILAYF